MVTDYDCWHEEHGAVDVASVIQVAKDNAHRVTALLGRVLRDFPAEHEPCPVGSDRALEGAIITHPEARDLDLVRKLDAVAGRVLGARS
jgi:5'-methylthioadenosine phosphorylase